LLNEFVYNFVKFVLFEMVKFVLCHSVVNFTSPISLFLFCPLMRQSFTRHSRVNLFCPPHKKEKGEQA
jgi:hypothetical protein